MSNLTEKAIGEILNYQFFVPSYQRGFRWSVRQIEDLLEDINSFMPSIIDKTGRKTWYCLQPVITKLCNEKTKKENNLEGTWYEVIDGQQRLTAIYLIIHYANEMEFGYTELTEFQLKYETRTNNVEFIPKLKIDDSTNKVEPNYENIDFFYISNAYNKIHEWTKNFKNKHNKDFDDIGFLSKLIRYTKVIWYEIEAGKDPIEIFTRINMGKIPLTNAELIKALFLNSSNFPNAFSEEIKLRQLEIASEWDNIEYSLQNDELWYFINNVQNLLPTRIEGIFNIIYLSAKEVCPETKFRKENKIADPDEIKNRVSAGYATFNEIYGSDDYATFRFFSEKFKSNTKDQLSKNWLEIKRTFQIIEEWFFDRVLYHKIGYLITIGQEIITLLNAARSKQKQEFSDYLDDLINKKTKCGSMEELEYGNDSDLIRIILLSHNIKTMLCNKNETSRFPFNRFKKEKWDIEHIHAIATEVKVSEDNQKKWLENNYLASSIHDDNELNQKIESIKNGTITIPITDDAFSTIINYVLGEEDNSIKNLCLLDRGTNRSYKNDSFI
jgi:uncharacterized protein with ParB-like and HNH nuclease domain